MISISLSTPVATIHYIHPESPSVKEYCADSIESYTPQILLPGEKLVTHSSTLINNCDRPMEIRYFGPADIEPEIRHQDDFDLIYTIPNTPSFPLVIHEINDGKGACFALCESTQVQLDPRFHLARISCEELAEIEKKWQKPS